jgi:hypothetical protein
MNLDHVRGRSIRNRIAVMVFIYIVVITCSSFILAPKPVGIPRLFEDGSNSEKTWRFRYEVSNMPVDSKLIISHLVGKKSANSSEENLNQIDFKMRLFATDKVEAKDVYMQYSNDFDLIPYELDIHYPSDISRSILGKCHEEEDDNLACSGIELYQEAGNAFKKYTVI